ncbi:hypothetical protein, partial [Salmonella enterica]|uniref:hypothetical protein n=1 Tax=Salmonella enterica TaxID=28901 RepID=UPI0022B6C71C
LIEKKYFSEADDYLTWRYGEDDEKRKNLKKEMYALETMDPTEFCHDLINKEQFRDAIEYLKWRFESEEERRQFKKSLYESDEWLR